MTKYLLDTQPGLAKVLAETNPTITNRYAYSPAGVAMIQENTGWFMPLRDGLGSVRRLLTLSGTPQASKWYDPYGQPYDETGAWKGTLAFTGEQRDSNGLQYHRARYYRPALGAWTALDPMETPNRYGYVGGNVVNAIDPTGLVSWRQSRPAASHGNISYREVPVEEGDCLTCMAKEAGIFDAYMWNPPVPLDIGKGPWAFYKPFEEAITSHPSNLASGAIYFGPYGDPRLNTHVNGQQAYVAVPGHMVLDAGTCGTREVATFVNGMKNEGRCYCRNQCPPNVNCGSGSQTPTPQPSGGCDLIATGVASHGFKLVELGAFVIGGGKTSITVLWDAHDSFLSENYVVFFSVEAGLGGEVSIPNPFRFFEIISDVMNSIRNLNSLNFSVAGYDFVFSEATLDQIAGLSVNLSANAVIFELGASVDIAEGCPTTGEVGIDLNILRTLTTAQWTVGASGTVAGTDVLYDGRTKTLFPNSFFLPH